MWWLSSVELRANLSSLEWPLAVESEDEAVDDADDKAHRQVDVATSKPVRFQKRLKTSMQIGVVDVS